MSYEIRMTITDETKWVSWGQIRIHHITGYNNNASDDRYIQLFEKPAAAIAASDVPTIPGLFAPAAAPFDWPFPKGLDLSELSIAISSTQVNYTAVTNTGLDLVALVDSDCLVGSTTTLTGDLTTGVARKVVWADASGPKKLLRVDFKNNFGATVYAFVSGDAGSGDIIRPMSGPFKVTDGETKNLFFGRGGLSPKYVTTAGVLTEGCEVVYSDDSSTSPIDTNAPQAATDVNIRAIYE